VAGLVRAGHGVRAVVRGTGPVRSLELSDAEIFRADLCRSDYLADAFDGVDVLVHFAASLSSDSGKSRDDTQIGTQRLLKAMEQTPTRRIVLASSQSVYDWRLVRAALTEDSPLEGDRLFERDGYAVAKALQEDMVRRACGEHGWELTILRPGPIWGAGRTAGADAGVPIGPFSFIIGPRRLLRATYVENCAEAFVLAAAKPGLSGTTFNIADSDAVSAWRYAREVCRREERRSLLVPVPYWLGMLIAKAAHGVLHRWHLALPAVLTPRCFEARFHGARCSADAARVLLSWCPRYGFLESMERTFETLEDEGFADRSTAGI